jgi:hypothetical protein
MRAVLGFGWVGWMNVFDFFHGEVGVCGYAYVFGLHVDDYEERVGCVFLEELVDLQIAWS